MTEYIGTDGNSFYNSFNPRYLYAIGRDKQGNLFVTKVDQASKSDSIQINSPGNPSDDYTNFREGEDFFEGRDANHNLVYPNLNYEQWFWDSRNALFFVDENGNLVMRIGQGYEYPPGMGT